MMNTFLSLFQTEQAKQIFSDVLVSAPFWIPLLFIFICFDLWLKYKQREWIKAQGSVLLEIRLPSEIFKSPQAMEFFFNSLYSVGVGSLLDVYLKGRVRQWFSLEIVSLGGQVHFYIWAFKNMKERISAQLYAQFPNIEVHEVADYALTMQHDLDVYSFGWIGQMILTKADAYPIKTYIEYGLNDNDKEEYKHDPLVPMLEFMGSLKQGEQAWVQILIQPHGKEGLKYGRIFTKPDWKPAAEKEIKEFIKKNVPAVEGKEKQPTHKDLTKDQQDVIASIQRTVAKNPFDTMIRAAYIAKKDVFNPVNIGGLLGSFSQFSSQALNGFKPGYFASRRDYIWQDPTGAKKRKDERALLEAYKRRAFFNTPFRNFHAKPYILTTEELATIFHFPSAIVAATPTLARLPSKKAEAPTNLPV